jgi:hypothetical protein
VSRPGHRRRAGAVQKRLLGRLLLLFVLCATVNPGTTLAADGSAGGAGSAGRDFYVSPQGSDANSGTTAAAPWRTLAKIDSADLRPGDRVHLQGGARFSEPLAPFAGMAGTSTAPISFDSYGSGRATLTAGIFLKSVANLEFVDFNVTSREKGIFSSAGGSGVHGVRLHDMTVSDVPLAGISSNNRADSGWVIEDVTISHTGDSGIYFVGSKFTIARSTIADTGTNASIAYPRHGIYAAGPTPTIVNNTIRRSSTSGVSLRYQDSVVQGNRIVGGVRGVSFEEQATVAGRTRIVFNTISDVADSGIIVARPAIESFVVANNTIRDAGAYGMYFQAVPKLTIANNIVDSSSASANMLSVRTPTLSFIEHNNLWHGGSPTGFYWNGAPRTLDGYRSASGEGLGDRIDDPKLGEDFTPAANSPAVDAGSKLVDGSLRYRESCDAILFDYCGNAPDLGSHERVSPLPADAYRR